MTTKELAKDLKEHIGCGIEVPLYDEELEVVVEALEKQIAKKSKIYNDKYFDMFDCPNCKQTFDAWEGYSYCPECGQKLNLET